MGLPDIDDPTVDFELPYEDYSYQADPETDVKAAVVERICVDLSGVSQTIARAAVQVDADGAGGESIIAHRAVWGNTVAVKPTLTRNGAGDYTITWAASYDDLNPTPAKRVTSNVNFQLAGGTINQAIAGCIAVVITAANVLRVYTYTHAGVAADYDFTAWGA